MSRLFALWVLFPLLAVSGCSSARDPWEGTPAGQKRVLVSFPPLYSFAAGIAKDHARVMCLQTGVGPHDYEATPTDARKVAGADIFFVVGLELDEKAAERLIRLARAKNVKLEALGDEIDHELLEHMAHEGHDHKDDKHAHHHHGEHDPHVWLGLAQAQDMVKTLAKKLGETDPANKDAYAKNAQDYVKKLKDLEAYGKEQFKNKKNKTIITMHESLVYFAQTFQLQLEGSIQPRPGIEADATQLARLVDMCKKKNVAVIAVEPQYARGQAETLARALRDKGLTIQIAEIDPMETAAPQADGNPSPDLFLDVMKRNIDNLAKALP